MTAHAERLQVYGFWRSNAMYRVRVALNLKNVAYREIPVNLDAGEQHAPEFLARNPQASVPALVDGDLPPADAVPGHPRISRGTLPRTTAPAGRPPGVGRVCDRWPARLPATCTR